MLNHSYFVCGGAVTIEEVLNNSGLLVLFFNSFSTKWCHDDGYSDGWRDKNYVDNWDEAMFSL